MSCIIGVLVSLLLAFSLSTAINIPSLQVGSCPDTGVYPKGPDHCLRVPLDDPSSQKLRRDDIPDGISSIASDMSSIQAEAADFIGQVSQTGSDIIASATAAVDGAGQTASQVIASASSAVDGAVATASSWVSDTFNETQNDANDAGKGAQDWLNSDTNGMSNKALLGVVIAVPVVVILAMVWFCWWCCRRRWIGRQSAKRGTIMNIEK
ncbi:hypothetical protein QBC40DRAFT_321919 [Triangularia verruculosa]|uniref:Uncharacterized protein n=1 Tax=Triangularia verruculosa TaxID=2587418 RepID=A0AAN7AXQ9_9PEZI|nr:hypothetical protein QBC40DRAFT_321919 [Triangularia verruculosa]